MLEAGLKLFLTLWAVIAMIVGVGGVALSSYQWVAAEVFGKSIRLDGKEVAIDWPTRRLLALLSTVFGCVAAAGAWLYSNAWVAERIVSFISQVPVWGWVLFTLTSWFGITGSLSVLAGWPLLQRTFQRPHGEVLAKQRLKWAMMGKGVKFENVITIAAYRGGFGIRMNRLFWLFSRPVMVPWEQVSACAVEEAETKLVRVRFGELERATMVLPEECWRKIESHRPAK